MNRMSKDIMFLILNQLNDRDLVSYFLSTKKSSRIYNNQVFWFNRIQQKFSYIFPEVLIKYKKQLKYSWSDYYTKDLTNVVLVNPNILLVKSSREGRLDRVMIALNNGAESFKGLGEALMYGHEDIVKHLIKNGADIHNEDEFVLRWASLLSSLDLVKFLINKGANIHASDDDSLKMASSSGNLDVVKYLIKEGANIHAEDDAAIKMAYQGGHLEVVKYLESLYCQN